MSSYDNGELITKDRMEDEVWYSDYQTLISFAMGEDNLENLINNFQEDYKDCFGIKYENKEQLERWAKLQIERSKQFKKEYPEYWKDISED